MAERGDVAIDSGMTPAECADRLGAEGFDRDAVEELTELFQRVRYGSAVTTTERVERARECLQRSVPTTDGESDSDNRPRPKTASLSSVESSWDSSVFSSSSWPSSPTVPSAGR